MTKRFDAMGDSAISQAADGVVKTEYAALGMDTVALQNNYVIRTGALMLLISLLSGVCTIMVGFLSAKAAAGHIGVVGMRERVRLLGGEFSLQAAGTGERPGTCVSATLPATPLPPPEAEPGTPS